MTLEVYDRVKLINTAEPMLDGQIATIMGWASPDRPIILFDMKPQGHAPAIAISIHCLEKI